MERRVHETETTVTVWGVLMPQIDVTKNELEHLIACVMDARADYADVGDHDYLMALADLHLKLENALQLWTEGGTVELPIPPSLQRLGVTKYEKEYPPHPE